MEIVAKKYGEVDAKEFVPGAEILLERENTENNDNSDNESDEEWVDVSHSEDEIGDDEENKDGEGENDNEGEDDEGEDDEDINELDDSICTQGSLKTDKVIPKKKVVTKREQLAEKKEKAAQVSTMRILTDEDFKRIEIAQLNKQMTSAKNRKRPAEPDETSR